MDSLNTETVKNKPYLSAFGAWALAFGCSVGWGAFVMPGTTFLPIAGPIGTVLGICLGAVVMIVLAWNYSFLMKRFRDGGGTYTYTKEAFGYDQGFLCAWFLILTYIAIIWANATALPLIARTLLGSTFQFGFDYVIAGFHVYMGELILAIGSLLIAALICMNRKLSQNVQVLMALIMIFGIVISFFGIIFRGSDISFVSPAFASDHTPVGGILTIFALAPWAYVGFESISHSNAEAKYNRNSTMKIFVIAIISAAVAYSLLSLIAVTAAPDGIGSWVEYVAKMGDYSGVASQPVFYSVDHWLGTLGSVFLGAIAVSAIFTGLIGNYIALSRLLKTMSDDGLLNGWVAETNEDGVPKNAILGIFIISAFLPLFGRTAISWIVDVTTVGATIAYAYASACAYKYARDDQNAFIRKTGIFGIVASVLFALEFLIPNITSVATLSTESYLILAAWSIIGFMFFRHVLNNDKKQRFGRSIIAWIVLLGLIIFTSSVWLRQAMEKTVSDASEDIAETMNNEDISDQHRLIQEELNTVDDSISIHIIIQITLIVGALLILLDINARIQKRERQTEIEKVLAEESSRAKTSFLSNMSHEIRTPMNAIIGLDNIALRDPNLPAKTRDQLEKIGASARHLLGLINDILDMSRIESGRIVLKNEEFSFREFIDQVNIIINGQCADKGLEYECNILNHINDYYIGDDMKLKQILINILGNSVKFTEAPGKVTLNIEQLAEFEGHSTLRFTMKDTGIGMDEEYIPKIFEAFSQEDATSTNKYGGSGLGMAITKNFVELMNGDINVTSKKGVGSVFTVTVSLKASARSVNDENTYKLPNDIRTIIVDDDLIACEHVQDLLRSLGIESDTFISPKRALAVMDNARKDGNPYQLLITDYVMPEMNGLDMIRKVRESDDGETMVLMLSGYNWESVEAEAKEAGVDSIMTKPVFSDTLNRHIAQIIEEKTGKKMDEAETEETIDLSNLAGRRILMAEDVEQNAEILLDLLELEEIEAEHARNGKEAVEMFSSHEQGYYDAILMDVRMPVMDGLSATKEIRNLDHPDAKRIPIIAMTANVFDEDVEKSLQAGMNAHLSKPIEPELMYETLAKLIEQR